MIIKYMFYNHIFSEKLLLNKEFLGLKIYVFK